MYLLASFNSREDDREHDDEEERPDDEVDDAHGSSLPPNVLLKTVPAVIARVEKEVVVLVMMVMVLPVGPVAMRLAHVDTAATLVPTAQVPVAVIVVHVHTALDGALMVSISGLVAAQLLDYHDLRLRLWASDDLPLSHLWLQHHT